MSSFSKSKPCRHDRSWLNFVVGLAAAIAGVIPDKHPRGLLSRVVSNQLLSFHLISNPSTLSLLLVHSLKGSPSPIIPESQMLLYLLRITVSRHTSRALLDAALSLLCITLGCSDGILCCCCKVMLATRLPPYLRYTLLMQFTELRSRTGMHILTGSTTYSVGTVYGG
jgi:hypothetical protein